MNDDPITQPAPQPSEAEVYWRLQTARWDRETARREAAAKRKRKAARDAAKKAGRRKRKKIPKTGPPTP